MNNMTLKERAVALLRWSERYTKTDMVYLAKGGSWLGLGQVVSSLVAFLLSVAFANLFPKEAYGEYRYIFSIIGVAGAFSLTGMDAALSQAVARGFDGTLEPSARSAFRWSLGTSGVLIAVAVYYAVNGNDTLAWSLVIAALATPLLKSSLLYSGFLIGKKDFGRKTRFGMVYDVVPAVCMAGALVVTDNTILIVAAYFLAYTATAGILFGLTKKVHPIANKPSDDLGTLHYSKHLSLMNVVGTISFQLDKILTFHYLGAAQLATYAFAIAIPQQIRQIQKHIATLAFPKFAERSLEDIRSSIHKKALQLFAVMAFIAAAYYLAAPIVYKIFFPQYLESIGYSQVYVLVLLSAPATLFKQALAAHKKTKELYALNTILPILKICLLFVLVPRLGISGTVLAFVIAEFSGLVVSTAVFYSTQKQKVSNT